MNRPPNEYKRVPAEQLRTFGTAVMEAAGMPSKYAEQLATLLTNSSLRGVHSHGIRAISSYSRALRDQTLNPNPTFTILKESKTSILLDGDGGLGYAPMMQATEMAIKKAHECGIAAGAVCHVGHYGSAGHYVRRAMEENCTAFSVQGRHPIWYRDNAQKPSAYLGNPPICFGLPSKNEPPLILDAAACILGDDQRGPEYDALQELIPAAFFKSMGYAAMGMLWGGAFVGQNNERAKEIEKKWPRAHGGGFICVMELDLFASEEEFRAGVDDLIQQVRENMLPVAGYSETSLPGEPEMRNEQNYARDGIPMPLDLLEQLEQTGKEFDVHPPWKK